MSRKKAPSVPALTPPSFDAWEFSAGLLACGIVFLIPFLSDEKLVRLKLRTLEAGVFALLFTVGLRFFFRERPSLRSPVAAAVAAWMLVMTGLFFAAPEPSLAQAEWRRVLLAGAAFFAFYGARLSAGWNRRVLIAWSGAGLFVGAYGLLQRTGGVGSVLVPQMDRVMSTYGNPIFFAAFLVPTFFVTMEALQRETAPAIKAMLVLSAAVQLIALYFTKTRAAWLALIMAGSIACVMRFGKGNARWSLLALLIALGSVFGILTKNVWSRDQGHALIWRDTVRLWKDHAITGVGLGAFHTNFESYAQDDLKAKWPQGQFVVNYAHNEYLQTLAEAGLVGCLAFLLIPVAFFIRHRTETWLSTAALALFIENFFSADMRFGVSFAFAFVLMGIAEAQASGESWPNVWPASLKWTAAAAWAALFFGKGMPRLLAPVRAQQEMSAATGFFDQRLLDPAKTIADMEALRQQYPMEPSVLEKLAYVYAKEIQTVDKKINQERANQAIRAYQDLIAIDPARVAAYNNMANIYYTIGKSDEAIAAWEKALQVKPDFLDAHLNLGKILYVKGRLKEAAAHFDTVLRLDPSNAEAQVYLKRMVE